MGVNYGGVFQGRRVLVTGHTGFKGSWLFLILQRLGANLGGFSLPVQSNPALFQLCQPWQNVESYFGDIREAPNFRERIKEFDPEIIIHMAAQALVRESYRDPAATFSTNIQGTVNLFESFHDAPSLKVVLIVTSDKVYQNVGDGRQYKEDDALGGGDPYSASKACTEIVAAAYPLADRSSLRVATVRAGNVVGGGDWSIDRLIPDFIRSLDNGKPIILRHPDAVRPWQHVLDVLNGYLRYTALLWRGEPSLPNAINFGPSETESPTVSQFVDRLSDAFGLDRGWQLDRGNHLPEADLLRLNVELSARALNWRPLLSIAETVAWTAHWYQKFRDGHDARSLCLRQIAEFEDRVSCDSWSDD